MALKQHMLIVLFWILPAVDTAESYLCIPDMSSGFNFDSQSGTWKNARFTTQNKYIVSRSTQSSNSGKWEIKETGQSIPTAFCEDDFTEAGGLRCSGFVEFRMNKRSRHVLHHTSCYAPDLSPGPAFCARIRTESQIAPSRLTGRPRSGS